MATDILNDATISTSLVSAWALDEASGATRVDAQGSNDLSDNSTVDQGTGHIQDNSANFSGTDYLSISDASQSGLDGMTDLSIAAWVNPDTLSNSENAVVSKFDNGAGQRQYEMNIRSTGEIRVSIGHAGGSTASSVETTTSTITVGGGWFHIGFSFDGSASRVRVYLNGSELTNNTVTATTIVNSGAPFHIGTRGESSPAGQFFDGQIEQVLLWNKVAAASEFLDIYASGTGIPLDAGGGAGAFNFSQAVIIG